MKNIRINIKLTELSNFNNNYINKYFDFLEKKNIKCSFDLLEENALPIIKNYDKYKSFLIYGDVQSGKTNNLIFLILKLIEQNKIDLIIYLTGSKNDLLNQNQIRFYDSLKSINDKIKIFKNQSYLNKEVENNLNKNNKVVVNSLKTNFREKQISNLLMNIPKKYNVLIIDDEADEYSLTKNSQDFYNSFSLMENIKFLHITASPFLNLKKNESFYNYFHILTSPEKYYGIEKFKNNFIIDNSKKGEVLMKSFIYWIITTCLNKLENSQLLINLINETKYHDNIFNLLSSSLYEMKSNKECIDFHIKKYFPKYIKNIDEIFNFIKKLNNSIFVIANSKNKEGEIKNKGFEVIIGGLKLSRGITYENLIVETMLNIGGEKINAGTLIQRARWFGYRESTINLIKIFINENIKNAFDEIENLIIWTKKYDLNNRNYSYFFKEKKYKYIRLL